MSTMASSNQQPPSSSWSASTLSFFGIGTQNPSQLSETSGTVADSPAKPKARKDDCSCEAGRGDFSAQKLSHINGAINKMTKEELQQRLKSLRLNANGVKDVMKKRLKHFYKQQKFGLYNKNSKEELKFDYLVVIDFEATCSETNENFVHEIIEFPAVLVDAQSLAVCNVFQRFCKPNLNPRLTQFCSKLTGITQAQVDKSKDFVDVLKEFEEWLAIHKLGKGKKFVILTDGPWDMARFLKTQTDISGITFPSWAKRWINLRKAYSAFYGCGRVNLQHMLDDLGMTFQGRPHCGLDDARNIAAIAIRLLEDGCLMRINEYLHEGGDTSKSRSYERVTDGTDMSPQKSRMTQVKHRKTGEPPVTVEQDGESLDDLLLYLSLQKS